MMKFVLGCIFNAVVVTCIVDAGDKLKSYGRFHVPEFVSVDYLRRADENFNRSV